MSGDGRATNALNRAVWLGVFATRRLAAGVQRMALALRLFAFATRRLSRAARRASLRQACGRDQEEKRWERLGSQRWKHDVVGRMSLAIAKGNHAMRADQASGGGASGPIGATRRAGGALSSDRVEATFTPLRHATPVKMARHFHRSVP